jgi:predicted ATP-binding protein involved in virulence
MRITQLIAENFRNFENLQLDFQGNLCVILGVNGAGKSNVLELIGKHFYKIGSEICFADNQSSTFIVDKNISILNQDFNKSDFIKQIKSSASFTENIFSKKNANLKCDFIVSINNQSSNVDGIFRKIEKNTNIPVLVFYSIERGSINLEKKARSTKNRSHFTYLSSLDASFSLYTSFVRWFEDEENYENQQRLDENIDYRNPKLELIRTSISSFFSQLANADFKQLKVKKKRNDNDFNFEESSISKSLTILKNQEELNVEQLSAGEKNLLLLVVDITRRLAIANPSLENPLLGEGIVLIDEIDLHLHPQWQREVISALMSIFPNIQFIVTTHSPQVLSKIRKENIVILKDNQVSNLNEPTFGRDHNSILAEVFGLSPRPNEVQKQINQCYRLIDEENFDGANHLLQELKTMLGDNDYDVVSLKTQLDFYL